MESLFTKDFIWLWALVLAIALFFPVRRLIWVLYVRRAMSKAEIDEAERERLRRRAGATSILLCVVFAYLYVSYMFRDAP